MASLVQQPDVAPVQSEVAPCPVCSAQATLYCIKSASSRQWPILRCTRCRHGFVHPRPTLEDVSRYNADETAACDLTRPDPAVALARRDIRSMMTDISRLATVRGRSLDIGSGDGSYSIGLAASGYTPHLIDLDPRGRLATDVMPGSTFAQETFEGLSDRGPYALILMSQVLEHALDPLDWLRRSRDLLVPGGLVAIALPNFGGIYRLLGSRDPYLIPPVHVNFFTAESMRQSLIQTGLTPIRIVSESHTTPRRGDGRIGLKRAALAGVMEVASLILDPLARGIILRAYARRAV